VERVGIIFPTSVHVMLLMVNNNGFNSRLNSAWTRKEACITSACVTGK
jgi:hypothetical protein